MSAYTKKVRRSLLTGLVCLLVLCGVTAWGRRAAAGAFAPFSKSARGVCSFFVLLWENVFHTGRIEELQDCERQLAELKVRIAELDEIKEENAQLRNLHNLPAVSGWKAVLAQVSVRDPAVWNWTFRVNVGHADGIIEGAPVMCGAYLAGRVGECNEHSALVNTLSNPACTLSVYVVSQNGVYPGVLRGTGAVTGITQSAVVDFIQKDAVIQEGAQVVTSGLGVELPGGLAVGTVKGEPRSVGDASLAVDVALGADIRYIKFITLFKRNLTNKK